MTRDCHPEQMRGICFSPHKRFVPNSRNPPPATHNPRPTSAQQTLRLGTALFIAAGGGEVAIGRSDALAAHFGLRLADLTIHITDVPLELADSLADGCAD